MAASPAIVVSSPVSNVRRHPLALTQRRLEANRRNAARSTGPRSAEGKAKVARNPIKHGFFVAQDRWTSQQQRDFEETLAGLRDDFKPATALEERCVRTIAESYVKMAAVWRYENIAALKYHEECEREMNQRIATAEPAQAAHLRAEREQLRRAGLWRPTIPGPREANAILRYEGRLNRTIHRAICELQEQKSLRIGGTSSRSEVQKQTHFSAPPRSGPEALRRASNDRMTSAKAQKQSHYSASPDSYLDADEELQTLLALLQKVQKQTHFDTSRTETQEPRVTPSSSNENVKANPLSSMFTGNRHQRRRAKALAARRR